MLLTRTQIHGIRLVIHTAA